MVCPAGRALAEVEGTEDWRDSARSHRTRPWTALRVSRGRQKTRTQRTKPTPSLAGLERGTAPVSGEQDGYPCGNGGPHGPRNRPRPCATSGDGRAGKYTRLILVR